MHVTREARERVSAALLALSETGESEVETAQRAARRSLGHDGVRFFERSGGAGRESLLVAEVDELKETNFYGSGGSTSSRVHSRSFRPRSLFGTVVLRWPDRHASMRMLDGSEKGPLVLLSVSEEAPLGRYDRYDERSLIENRLNRDAKQHFGLGASLARNERSMWSGAVFSTLALLLYRALEIRDEEALEALDRRAEGLGVLRYRRQVELGNRGKVIVTAGTEYGIFTYYEFGRSVGLDLG